MSIPSTFPSTNSIPPPCFYDIRGLANWLNNNPTYKQYFINYPDVFTTLLSNTNTISYNGFSDYDVQKVPLASNVTNMSQVQLMRYTEQLKLFRQVYAYNSNAYVNYVTNGATPAYYRFQTYKERDEFKSSVSLVNKLYPFQAMMNGTNTNGVSLGWIVPFPLQ
jgi:hypothetical protein